MVNKSLHVKIIFLDDQVSRKSNRFLLLLLAQLQPDEILQLHQPGTYPVNLLAGAEPIMRSF